MGNQISDLRSEHSIELKAIYCLVQSGATENFTSRKIAIIKAVMFYQSSGRNSHYPGTWFPFLGIQERNMGPFARGWYRKPFRFVPEIKNYISDCERELLQRFGTIPTLLISAKMGGGYWDTKLGIQNKAALEKQFPKFFQNIKITFMAGSETHDVPDGADLTFKDDAITAFNHWALKIADPTKHRVDSELPTELPLSLDDFLQISDVVIDEQRLQGEIRNAPVENKESTPDVQNSVQNQETNRKKLSISRSTAVILLGFALSFLFLPLLGILTINNCLLGAGVGLLVKSIAFFLAEQKISIGVDSNILPRVSTKTDLPIATTITTTPKTFTPGFGEDVHQTKSNKPSFSPQSSRKLSSNNASFICSKKNR